MSFTVLTNLVTMMFCIAVLVQSVRLLRALRAVKGEAFGTMIAALDTSTTQARRVLSDLRKTLEVDCAANARVVAAGEAMREELTVMSGIADAVAERIVEAVGKTGPAPAPKPRRRPARSPASAGTPASGTTA